MSGGTCAAAVPAINRITNSALSFILTPASLLPHQPLKISFVFANALHQFIVREDFEWNADFPRLRVCLRIVDGNFVFQMPEVTAMEAFRRMVRIRVRVATVVEIRLVVET